ncbi:hypothetical protein K3495_g5828 [Podosphaera aphanis]|nr:hypothetical protein K3495_g5828 [Podosphaera aphanis]
MALRTLEIRNSKSSVPEVVSGNKTTPEFTVVTKKSSEARRGPGRPRKEQAAPTASLIPVSSPISVKATPPHEGTIQASSTQQLLAATRQACRQAKARGEIHDEVRGKALRGKTKKEINQVRRSSWRNFVAKSTSDIGDPSYKGLWGLSRWAKKENGVQLGPPHFPALRRNSDDTPTHDNSDKAKILQEKFFPYRVEADLSDITANCHRKRTIEVRAEVTPAEFEDLLRQLPTGKAPGPDENPNEILKSMLPEWKSEMAASITATLLVRPTMLYGAQIWGMKSDGQPMAKSLIDKLGKIPSKCLRKITGGYKRTPRLALERKAAIPPIDLQVQSMSLLYGANTAKKAVTTKIYHQVNDVWHRIRLLCKKRNASNRKKSAIEAIRQKAVDIEHEIKMVTKKLPRHPCLHPSET